MLSLLLWTAGVLIFINIIGMFLNEYFDFYYPFIQLLLWLIYVAGLVLISVWYCNDTKATRTNLRIAAYLIIGSLVAIILWNIIWVCGICDTPNVWVGTGDKNDSDNYEEQSKGMYILGYILIGIILLIIATLFILVVEFYKT